MKIALIPLALLLGATAINPVHAALISQWTFNSAPPDNSTGTGVTSPSTGAGTATLVGGVTAGFASGSTNDPASSADDTGWNTSSYPGQGIGNKTAGVQFAVSTLGNSNIVVRWDHRVSSTASRFYRFQYSTDGVTFTDYGPPIAAVVASASSQSYYEPQTNSLADIPGVNDNANFAFRILSEFESTATGAGADAYVTTYGTNSYSTGGTVRFDLVTVSGSPIPGANTAPTISSISNQTIRVNQSTAALPFVIGDAEDQATSLSLKQSSSDQSVIPDGSIHFGGSGPNRSVTVNAGSQTGVSQVTLYVIDTGGRSNSTSFTVTVLPLNTAPIISPIPPTSTLLDTPTPEIQFTLSDLETTSASLTVSGHSANQSLVPDAKIVFGGSGSNRTVTVTPAIGQTGVAPLTITVSDGANTASTVFPLMVLPSPDTVFYDPFAYSDGSLLTNSAFLWANRSGTIGECQNLSGQLQVTGSQTEDVLGALIGGPYLKGNGLVLYAGFKLKALSLPKSTPAYLAHFNGSNANRGRVYAGTTNAGPNTYRLFVGNGTGATTMFAANLSTNVFYTVVTRYDIDSATTTLWINPTAESDAAVTASDSPSVVNISSYGFRQDTGLGGDFLVDDLRVGLSFAAVVSGGTTPSPIPLNAQRSGGQIILSWGNPAFVLQSAPTAGGVYTNIAGAASPFTNGISGQAKFFRLKAN